jgi:hypothetical protein
MNDDQIRNRLRSALDRAYRPAPRLLDRCEKAVKVHVAPPSVIGKAALYLAIVAVAGGAAFGALVLRERGHSSTTDGQASSTTVSASPGGFALLADNRVVAFDVTSLQQRWSVQLASPPPVQGYVDTGHLIALSQDRSRLYVIPLLDDRGGTEVEVLASETGVKLGSLHPGIGDIEYRSLAVGSVTGRLYLVGADAARIVTTVMDASAGVVVSSVTSRLWQNGGSVVGNDFPYQVTITSDEGVVAYSTSSADYHRAGLDWFAIHNGQLDRCNGVPLAQPCMQGVSWGVAQLGGSLLAVNNQETLGTVDVSSGARADVLRLPIGDVGTGFLEDLAFDGRRVVVLGSCAYGGGLALIDVQTKVAQSVAPAITPTGEFPPPIAAVCGQLPIILSDGSIVFAHIHALLANVNGDGRIYRIDPSTGTVQATSHTFGSDPVALIATL